jgi:hypothetical protein
MEGAGWLIVAVLVAYACAIAAALVRRALGGTIGASIGWCFLPVVIVCPVLIPAANLGLRAASAFVSGDIAFKMVDYFRIWDRVDGTLAVREFLRFLVPFPILAAAYPDHKRPLLRPERSWAHVLRLFVAIAGAVVAVLAVRALSGFAAVRTHFALNHALMLFTFVLAIESLSRAICALERLGGFDTAPIVRNAYQSRTVSEFWRRYNYRIHDWLYRNVFRPTGGRRAPVRSVLLVFFVSGLFHEAAFALATSRLTGYQLAFFTIQGPAALASGKLERLARRGGIAGKLLAHGTTIVFLAVTSVLFFEGVGRIFPFIYASPSPLP